MLLVKDGMLNQVRDHPTIPAKMKGVALEEGSGDIGVVVNPSWNDMD